MNARSYSVVKAYRDLLVMTLVCLVLSFVPALAEKRVALVIGNSNYLSTTELENPRNDANDIANVLERLGFDVVLGIDLDYQGMRKTRREFSARVQDADVALFFYAGHALQVDGVNYLLPVDAKLQEKIDLEFETVSLDPILSRMERHAKTNLVFLDACRDNPLAKRFLPAGRSADAGSGGLAEPTSTHGGAFIAFATSPGDVALDGTGRNSPFTTSLLKNMERPGVELNTLMIDVRAEVYASTGQQQRPWTNSGLLGRFYFNGQESTPAPEPEPDPEKLAEQKRLDELQHQLAIWSAIRNTSEPLLVRQFLETNPDSKLARLAELKLEELRLLGSVLEPKNGSSEVVKNDSPSLKTGGEDIQVAALPETNVERNVEIATPEPLSPGELTRSVQTELNRVGCNAGTVDGQWGPKGRRSLESFSKHSGVRFASIDPSRELLDELLSRQGRVCPLVCGVKYINRGEQCIRKTCAAGHILSSKGTCYKRKTVVKKTTRTTTTIPAPKTKKRVKEVIHNSDRY